MEPHAKTCGHFPTTVLQHPPDISENRLEVLVSRIKDYQITHGSLIKVVRHEEPNTVPAVPIGASVFPTPFPRRLFNEAHSIQHIFNKLYILVCEDVQWLGSVVKPLAERDEFIGSLWKIYCNTRNRSAQRIQCGVFRSDYMMQGESFAEAHLKQVEMNTFSVAGGTHANIVANMHHHLQRTGKYEDICKQGSACQALPQNDTLNGIVHVLADAHELYYTTSTSTHAKCILMVVQPSNVNICDERPIEYRLCEQHNIPVFRVVFGEELIRTTRLTEKGDLIFQELSHDVLLHSDSPERTNTSEWEVSVVYMRAGYDIHEYNTVGIDARTRIETSNAIKCPSIAGHLGTLKCVQQALCEPGSLERFLSQGEVSAIGSTFMPIYNLDREAKGREISREILQDAEKSFNYVLKPSLEGGGHNIFTEDLVEFLRDTPPADWCKYILMEMIRPPELGGFLMSPRDLFEGPVISELGIFGCCIWQSHGGSHDDNEDSERRLLPHILTNKSVGWSYKTKPCFTNEMSVVKGFGCFDTPLLIDS